jgi:hypothetical protein
MKPDTYVRMLGSRTPRTTTAIQFLAFYEPCCGWVWLPTSVGLKMFLVLENICWLLGHRSMCSCLSAHWQQRFQQRPNLPQPRPLD